MKKNLSPVLLALREAFPLAFPPGGQPPRPLAIGIREALMAWADTRTDIDHKQVHSTLARYCSRVAYRRALVAGALRVNLQGEPVDAVTAEAEYAANAAIERDLKAAEQAVLAKAQRKAQRQAKAAAQQAKLQAEAAARRAAKAAKSPKQKVKPPAPPPAPISAPPPKKPAPAIVVKKRRLVAVL